MAFSSLRGRPRKPVVAHDPGTPELRLKHALRLTAEPIDLCLEKGLISPEQHWCGLHLRWLYTLRYGAPSLTTRYTDRESPLTPATSDAAAWRAMREREYHDAIACLKPGRYYEPVMRLAVFNEAPTFLDPALCRRAVATPALAATISAQHHRLCEGLDLLRTHWHRTPNQ